MIQCEEPERAVLPASSKGRPPPTFAVEVRAAPRDFCARGAERLAGPEIIGIPKRNCPIIASNPLADLPKSVTSKTNREGSWALVVVLITYRHDYKGLPGSFWPRTLSGQCDSGDLWNHPKVMVSYGFHH